MAFRYLRICEFYTNMPLAMLIAIIKGGFSRIQAFGNISSLFLKHVEDYSTNY